MLSGWKKSSVERGRQKRWEKVVAVFKSEVGFCLSGELSIRFRKKEEVAAEVKS